MCKVLGLVLVGRPREWWYVQSLLSGGGNASNGLRLHFKKFIFKNITMFTLVYICSIFILFLNPF